MAVGACVEMPMSSAMASAQTFQPGRRRQRRGGVDRASLPSCHSAREPKAPRKPRGFSCAVRMRSSLRICSLARGTATDPTKQGVCERSPTSSARWG